MIHPLIYAILISLTPGVEARGAIPLAYYYGFKGVDTLILIYIFSSLPSIPVVYGLNIIENILVSKYEFFRKLYSRVLKYVRSRAENVLKYRLVYVGLALFVAVPLPGTGVWTASLIAHVFNMDRFKSIIAILTGNLIACTIIYMLVVFASILI